MDQVEKKFNDDMRNIYFTAKKDIGYTATRFIQLVSKVGGVKAAKQLITKEGSTYGFTILYEKTRLDLSVEVLVLKPEYEYLFTSEERILCKERLNKFGYDMSIF